SCPHCGSSIESAADAAVGAEIEAAMAQAALDGRLMPSKESASSKQEVPTEGLTKWEQDTFRDIINNVNNTLRFQIQLAVPLLAGCVTALNIMPPQEHQEFLNFFDRFVFIPVLLSMAVSYYALELHWGVSKDKPTDNVESLSRLVKKKYLMVHLAILLQGAGLVLLICFVLLEYK
ncbi:MAG: hypothetical protein K2X27_24615, partial [Candidatus Obscuribacterales bacterium]|nr:hypothetical protein [Candidatus Obscuribacterales bacterium]